MSDTRKNGEIYTADLRCFCKLSPLLGKYGKDEKGIFFEKKYREYVDMRVYGDCTIEVKCPSCYRMHNFHLKS